MTERLRAAIRLLYPDDMTPTARNLLTRIIEECGAPDTSGASEFKEDA